MQKEATTDGSPKPICNQIVNLQKICPVR